MLSGETASGKYPVESVKFMARIAIAAEQSIDYSEKLDSRRHKTNNTSAVVGITDAICYAACDTAADLKAAGIATVTKSGFTARMVSRFKPSCPIVGITSYEVTWRQMNLIWGCIPMLDTRDNKDIIKQGAIDMFELACGKAAETGIATDGELIVVVAGVPLGFAGTTNCIKVQRVGGFVVKGRGIPGEKSIVSGKASVVRVAEQASAHFKSGDVLVTTKTDDNMLPCIKKAAAVVVGSDKETDNSHAESICTALRIPLVICTEKVVDLVQNMGMVTVDAINGVVHNGVVKRTGEK